MELSHQDMIIPLLTKLPVMVLSRQDMTIPLPTAPRNSFVINVAIATKLFILLTDYESVTILAVRRIKYYKEFLHFSTEYYSTYLPQINSFSNYTSTSIQYKIIQLTMASRTSNPTTCYPVCSKEFSTKREKVTLNQYI